MTNESFKSVVGKFAKKLSVLTISNILTQVVSVVGFVFISRVYPVDSIGSYITYVSIVSILSICSTGNYEQALYVERSSLRCEKVISLSLACSFVFSLLVLIILFILGINYAFYIAFSMFSAGVLKTTCSVNIANNRLVLTSLYLLVVSPILPVLIVLNGEYFSSGASSIIILHAVISFLVSIVFLLITVKSSGDFSAFLSKNYWLQVFVLSKQYKKFFGYGMSGQLIATSAMRIPIFVANEYFSKQLAAYYGVVIRIAITPISIILGNVAQMFMQQISHNRKNDIPSLRLFIIYFCCLFTVGLFGVAVVLVFGHDLVIWLLSDKYETVSILLIDMLPYIFMLSVVSPLTSVLNVFEKQEYTFYNKIAFLIATLVCFGYGVYTKDFFIAVQSYSIIMAIIYSVVLLQIIVILYKDKLLLSKRDLENIVV